MAGEGATESIIFKQWKGLVPVMQNVSVFSRKMENAFKELKYTQKKSK